MKNRKRLNYRFIACMLAGAAGLGVGVHFVHGYQVKRNAGALLLQADRAKEEKDYAAELQQLSLYLGFEPDDLDARVRFGEALHERAKKAGSYRGLQEASFQLDTVLRRDPQRGDVRRRQVDIAMSLGRFGDALAHIKVLFNDASHDAELEQKMGLCHERLGRFQDAVVAYEKAIDHSPEKIENYLSLARLLHERFNKGKKANQIVDKMVEANPRAFQAYLGRVQYRLRFPAQSPGDIEGEIKKNKDDVAEARQLAPDEPEVVLAAAQVEQAQGKPEAARKVLLQGIQAHPSDPRPYLALIAVELREDKIKEALAHARQGLKEVPEKDGRYGDLLRDKADLLVQNGDLKEAEETIARLRRMNYTPALLDYLQARILAREKEWSKASTLLARVLPRLARAPALEVQALLLLGQCHEQLGNPDQALLTYQQARKVDPLSATAHYRVGSVLMALNRSDEALTEFRQVLSTAKKPADLRTLLVQTLLVRNRRLPPKDRSFTELRRELDLAAKQMPDSIEVPIFQAATRILQAETQFQLADPKQPLAAKQQDAAKHMEAARRIIEKARDAHPDEAKLWIIAAQMAGREEALGILQSAMNRSKLANNVELWLARLRYLVLPSAEAKTPEKRKKAEEDLRATLAQMEKEATKLAQTDRPRLLSGLADAYLRLGDATTAERLWRQVAEQQPTNLVVRLMLFDLALRAKSSEAMDRVLEEIRALEGKNGAYWRYAEASRLILKARPSDKDNLTQSGRHQLREARQALVQAAKQRPSWPRVPALEAEIDELEGHTSAAIEKYQQALALGERRPAIVRKAVALMYQQRRFEEANQAVHKLRDQGNTLVEAGLGKLAAMDLLAHPDPSNPDPQRALSIAEQSIASDSKEYQDHLWLGRVRWATGKPEDTAKAEASLTRACELGESVPDTWVTLVAFLASTGKKEKAEKAIAQATKKLAPDQAPLALAACYENIGDLQKAGEYYQAALKAAPQDVRMLRNMASFHLRHNQGAKAEPRLRAILALDSSKVSSADTMWARRALAAVLGASINRPRFNEALKKIEENLADNKDSVEDQHARALLLSTRSDRRKEAIRLFEELNHRGPLPAAERFTLVKLYMLDDNWRQAEQHMIILLNSPQGKDPTYEAFYARRLLQHDNVAAAQAQLEKLQKTLPDSPLTREIKARVLQAEGKDTDALAVVREYAQSKDADIARAGLFLETLANTKRKGNEPATKLYLVEAEAMLRRFAEQSDKPERFLPLAGFLARKRAVAEALDRCDEALRHKAPSETVALMMTEVLREAHPSIEHFRRVEKALNKMLAATPDSVPLLICMGEVYNLQERFSDAEEVYRRGLRKDADNVMLLNNLAWLLAFQDTQARQEARAAIEKAIEQVGPTPELLDTRGVIYLQLDQSKRAIDDLRAASVLSRKASHTFHLARALAATNDPNNLRDARQTLAEANKRGFDVKTIHPLEKQAAMRVIAVLQAN